MILDCIDGNVARVTRSSSLYGDYIDSLSSLLINSLILIALFVNYRDHKLIDSLNSSVDLTLVLILVNSFYLYSKILYQKYRASTLENNIEESQTISKLLLDKNKNNNKIKYYANRVEKNLGISGFLLPVLLLFETFNIGVYFFLIYIIYTIPVTLMSFLLIIKNVRKNDREKKI